MFNMNNSEASKRLVELLQSAVFDASFPSGNGGFYKGLAAGMVIYSGYWPNLNGEHIRVSALFDNAIAHAKAKKEQK